MAELKHGKLVQHAAFGKVVAVEATAVLAFFPCGDTDERQLP